LVLRDGLRPVVKGLVLGLVIGLGVRIVIRGQVFTTIAAWDPVEFTLLPAIFVAAALVASWLPAARASRVAPHISLRGLYGKSTDLCRRQWGQILIFDATLRIKDQDLTPLSAAQDKRVVR